MKKYIDTIKNTLKIYDTKRIYIVELFVSCMLRCIVTLLPPIATAGIIRVLTDGNFEGIWFYVLLYLIFYGLYFLTVNWNYSAYAKMSNLSHNIGVKKITQEVCNNNELLDVIGAGKILDTCGDDTNYIVDIFDNIIEAIMGIVTLIIIFFIFVYYNIFVAIIALLIDFAYIKLMLDNSKCIAKYYEGTRKYNDKILEILNNIMKSKQVKTTKMIPTLEKKIDNNINNWEKDYLKKREYTTDRYSKIPIIIYIGKIFLYIFLGYLVVNDKMNISILILLISYFEMVMTYSDNVLEKLLNFDNYSVRINRINTILDIKNNTEYGSIENDYINGLVEFQNVTYYLKNKLVLNNVSFKALPNEITAIVGFPGAGKTSIINLLYRLDGITKGKILIDNINIFDYSTKVYPSNVSGVWQNPFILDMSIKDNLALVDDNLDHIIDACKRVGLHNTIMNLDNKYNTKISMDSSVLSDGNKKLLMVARAILTNAEVLLFDEVDNNLDSKFSKKLVDIIKSLKEDHTIILVTRNKELMDVADNIVVLDDGEVIASGKNKDVLKKCNVYKELRNTKAL